MLKLLGLMRQMEVFSQSKVLDLILRAYSISLYPLRVTRTDRIVHEVVTQSVNSLVLVRAEPSLSAASAVPE
jgi:hypothetical protein